MRKLFICLDRGCLLPTMAVPGSHRAFSGESGVAPHGRRGVDGRTGGAHRNPRAGKGVKIYCFSFSQTSTLRHTVQPYTNAKRDGVTTAPRNLRST